MEAAFKMEAVVPLALEMVMRQVSISVKVGMTVRLIVGTHREMILASISTPIGTREALEASRMRGSALSIILPARLQTALQTLIP